MRRVGIDLDLQEVKDDEGAYDLRQAAEIHGRPCAEADQGENMNALRLAGIPVGAHCLLANVVRIKKEEKGEPLSSLHFSVDRAGNYSSSSSTLSAAAMTFLATSAGTSS